MRQRPDFRNFDLRIETADAGSYAVSVTASPAGATNGASRAPSPLVEIKLLLPLARGGNEGSQRLQRLGQRLTEFLLPPGEVRDLYNRCLGMMENEKLILRFRLDIAAPELAALPWECAYDEKEEYFALNPRFSMVRYYRLLRPADSVLSLTPVPILLVAASPNNLTPIAVGQEVLNLVQALEPLLTGGQASIDILFSGFEPERQALETALAGVQGVSLLKMGASLDALRIALKHGYRVLHFIGHGGLDAVAGGMLALTATDGSVSWVGEQTLARELREQTLAAVMLNVCRSATGDTARAFVGLAPKLIQAGIPAVMAMQHDISDAGARRFSVELYRSLAAGERLDEAVLAGRMALSAAEQGMGWEWAIPVLFMRAERGLLWEVDPQRVAVVDRMDALIRTAQTAAGIAAGSRAAEDELLARGLGRYAERLRQLASRSGDEGAVQPYRGLLEYRLGDADLFFGRGQASADLLDRLQRGALTVLHAESGAGKTSLLQAGIMPRLIADGHLPIHLRAYNLNPALALKRALLPEWRTATHLSTLSLREFLLKVMALLGPKVRLYLLLDQFEEFFAELAKPERDVFIGELVECVEDPLLNVCWLLALRSEAFSGLASFEPGIRNPFENNYRLERLTRAEAEAVIVQPAARFGISFEPALLAILLDDLDKEGVAPPQVQLVCQALYDERAAGEDTLTRGLYERLGGARGILQGHLERVLRRDLPPEQRVAAQLLLEALLSSEVRRVLRTRDELAAELAQRDVMPATVDTVLERLLESRLLRIQERGAAGEQIAYELAHDYLANQIQLSPEVRGRKAAQELLARELLSFKLHGTRLHPRALEVIGVHIDSIPIDRAAAELLVRSAFETGAGLEQWLPRVPADLARLTLLEGLQDGDPLLRVRAAQYIGATSDPEVVAALAACFTEDEVPTVREAAFTVLRVVAPERARQLGLDGLQHSAADRRAEAASLLESSLDSEVVRALFGVVIGDADDLAWQTALRVLSTHEARPWRDDWRPLRRATAARQAAAYGLFDQWRTPRSLAFHLRTLPALLQQYLKRKWRENWPAFIGAGLAALALVYLGVALWRGWPPFPAHWQRVPGTPAIGFSALAIGDDGTIYAGTTDYGLARRDPDGVWVFGLRDGLPTGEPANPADPTSNVNAIHDLAVTPGVSERVFALVADAGVFVSADAGAHWAQIGAGSVPTDTVVAVIAAYGETLLVADESTGLYGSGDGGQTWRRLSGQGGLPDSGFRAARFAPAGEAYVGGVDGVYRGAGAFPFVWEKVPGVPSVFYLDAGNGGRLFLGLGIAERSNQAACYTPERGLWVAKTYTGADITAVHRDPVRPDAIWVATTGNVEQLTCFTEGVSVPRLAEGVFDLVPVPAGDGGFTWLQASQQGLYQPPD